MKLSFARAGMAILMVTPEEIDECREVVLGREPYFALPQRGFFLDSLTEYSGACRFQSFLPYVLVGDWPRNEDKRQRANEEAPHA